MIAVQPEVPNLFEDIEEPVEFDIAHKRLVQNMIPIIMFIGLLSEFFVTRMKRVFSHGLIRTWKKPKSICCMERSEVDFVRVSLRKQFLHYSGNKILGLYNTNCPLLRER